MSYATADRRHIVFHASRVVLYRESLKFNPEPVTHQLRESFPPVAFQQHTLLDFEGAARRSNLRLFGYQVTRLRGYADLTGVEANACRMNALGFGNHGGITVTNVNVPASTVTALWQPGRYQGRHGYLCSCDAVAMPN